jgi:hypothetical protein
LFCFVFCGCCVAGFELYYLYIAGMFTWPFELKNSGLCYSSSRVLTCC